MIKCVFNDSQNQTKFLLAGGITPELDGTITIPMSLIPLAKTLNGTVSQVSFDSKKYLIKINDISTLTTPVSLVTDQGANGTVVANSQTYKIVQTTQGLDLFNELNGLIEELDAPIKLLSELTGNITNSLPADAQWPRLRMISRVRPFPASFALANTNFTRKPNLVIMDSGINFDHTEFTGLETEDLFTLSVFNGNYRDDAGHGTAVASFACGSNIGLHRHLRLLNCKIFSVSVKPNALQIGEALDAIYQRFIQDPSVPMIVNCSWTMAKSSYLEGKFQDLITAGITVVAASGNQGINCDLLTPAGMSNVITVGATDSDDIAAGFNNFSQADFEIQSNTGDVIDIFAPGVDCFGAYYSNPNSYCKFSGTSISAGFTSGAIAAILALVPNSYRTEAMSILLSYANVGYILLGSDFTIDQNKLLYLITAENQTSFVTSSFYLGVFSSNTLVINGNVDFVLDFNSFQNSTGESFTFTPIWDGTDLSSVFTIDNAGRFTLTNPTLSWDPDEKIRLISFKIRASTQSGSLQLNSPSLIFFASNPNVVESLDGDVSTALENIDNQSFFAAWVKSQMIK